MIRRRFRVERIGNDFLKKELPSVKYMDISEDDVNDIFSRKEIEEHIIGILSESVSEHKKPLVKHFLKITEIPLGRTSSIVERENNYLSWW